MPQKSQDCLFNTVTVSSSSVFKINRNQEIPSLSDH